MLAGDVDPRSSMQSVSSESRDLISWARLLERRGIFALWSAASCAVLSEQPKNFIKLCTTNAAGDRGASGPFPHGTVSRTKKIGGRNLLAVAGINFHRHRGGAARCRRTRCRRCGGGGYRLRPIRLRRV